MTENHKHPMLPVFIKDETINVTPETQALYDEFLEEPVFAPPTKSVVKRAKPTELFMVTMAPEPGTAAIGPFHSTVKARLKKKWIETYWYCFELTKERNPHVHLVIKTKGTMTSAVIKKGFNMKQCNTHVRTQDSVKKGLIYLNGYKLGLCKPMFKEDIKFRNENNLLSIYTNFVPSNDAQSPDQQ